MKFIVPIALILACLALAGCENKQAKLDKLQTQDKGLNQQYFDDCVAPMQGGTDTYFKGEKPKIATPEQETAHNQTCAHELKQVTALEQQMQAFQK